jgi:hypothetical protein
LLLFAETEYQLYSIGEDGSQISVSRVDAGSGTIYFTKNVNVIGGSRTYYKYMVGRCAEVQNDPYVDNVLVLTVRAIKTN